MSASALRAEIQDLVDTFVGELEELVRKAALETVTQLLQPGSAAAVGAKRNAAAAAPSRLGAASRFKSAAKKGAPKATGAGARVRRSTEQIEAAGERIVKHVEAHPGIKAEEIRAALDLPKNEWTLTVKRLVETGALSTKGEKRATQYFTRSAPRFGVIKRPGRGAPVVAAAAEEIAD